MLQNLPTKDIDQRPDARATDLGVVAGLSESIAEVGLINPIRVRAVGGRWQVVAGVHRLEACRSLGLVEVTCDVVEDDDLHAELAMIDENLCRAELGAVDRARHTARRKAIYEELHGPAKANSARAANEAMGHNVSAKLADTFAADTAKATGQSERAIQRDAERGKNVLGEVMDMIRGTKLETGVYLDKLKALPGSEQYIVARRDLAALKADDRKDADKSRRTKIDSDVKARAAKEVAEVIAEYVPGEWWDAVKANLYAAGAANIAHELTNLVGNSVMDRGAA